MKSASLQWNAGLYQDSSSLQFQLGLMAIDKLDPHEHEKILDIGCGNGMLAIELAKKIPLGHITGIEASVEMFAKAVHNSEHLKIDNIHFLNMNALAISFENEFDAVFSNSAIHWIQDLEKMYGLIFNALKPGGRIMIQTGLKEINKLIETIIVILQAEQYRSYLAGIKLPWRFLTRDGNVKILEEAGFADIAVEPHPGFYRFKTIEELSGYLESAPMVPFLSHIPDNEKEGFKKFFIKTYLKKNDNAPVSASTRAFISAQKPSGI